MRLLVLAALLLPATCQAGQLPEDPLVQLLVWGESAPVHVGREHLFSIGEGTLADKAGHWNARIRDEGRGDYSYACVTDGQWAVWMLSDQSDATGEPWLTAIIETRAPAPEIGCDRVEDLELMSSKEDRPGIAITLADLDDRIDLENINDNGLVGLRGQHISGDDGGSWDVISTVTYHITPEGSVDGVAYEVTTIH